MKTNTVHILGASLALFIAAAQANAQSITGAISFSGGATLNGPLGSASAFTSFEGNGGSSTGPQVLPGSQTGSYASVPDGTSATFSDFTFSPAPGSPTPLWTFTLDGKTYSFEITSVTTDVQTPFFLNLAGTGEASITGDTTTAAQWSITDTGLGGSPIVTLGAAVNVPSTTTTPDAASTIQILMGLGSYGLARMCKRTRV